MTVVVLILAGTGVALAAVGPSTFVSAGENGSASARSAQQPLGSLSATPPAPTQPGTTSAPEDRATTRGETEESVPTGGPGAGDLPTDTETTLVPTSQSSRLPFTGYLAIPILIAGVGLLGAGVVVRRRATRPAAA